MKNLRHGHMLETLLSLYKHQLLEIGFPEDGLKMANAQSGVSSTLPVVSVKNTKEVELYVLVLASKHEIGQKIWQTVIKNMPDGRRSLF